MNVLLNTSASAKKISLLLNIIGFQLCWAACVIGGTQWAAVCVPLFFCWHWTQRKPGELWLIALITLGGSLFDSLLLNLNLMAFPDHDGALIPLWLMLLWSAFAATLRHSMAWLLQKPLLAALLGGIAAPWSYYAGSLFDVIELTAPVLVLIAVAWALLLAALSLYWREK